MSSNLISVTIVRSCRQVFSTSTSRTSHATLKEAFVDYLPQTMKVTTFCERNPFIFQLGVATLKTMAADLMAQTIGEGKSLSEVDIRRNAVFVVFGFGYLGCFQYWIMVNKYRQWFPSMDRFAKLSIAEKMKDKGGMMDAMKMVLFDVCIHLPLMYFPSYYTVKELVVGDSWNPADWVRDGVTKYSKNIREDLAAMIKLWGPSDCIQFMLPVHIRMPFRHAVSFFWTAYVSFTRGLVVNNNTLDTLDEKSANILVRNVSDVQTSQDVKIASI
jgi:hypothetical protein